MPCIYLSLNEAMQTVSGETDLLGYKPDERVPFERLIHAQDQKLFTEASGSCNIRLRHADGRIRCFFCHYRIGDIIELRLEQSLATVESCAHLAALLKHSEEGIYFKNSTHVYIQAGSALSALLDCDSLCGKTDYDIFPEEQADARYRLEERALSEGMEVRELLQVGASWFDLRVIPLSETTGTVLMGIVRDMTATVWSGQELRIAAAVEAQESTVITDADTVILRVNQAFSQTTGYSREELLGQTPRLLKSGRHDAAFYKKMWESIELTGSWRGEIWDRRKNGAIYPKLLTISAVKTPEGVVTHYVGTHIDISDRKAAEEEIKHLAYFDQLTGLPNRRLLMDRLAHALAYGARSGTEGALLFIDLDNFRTLNETMGHNIGDLLLQQAAKRLEGCIRKSDTVARLGGDEFLVMLEGLSSVPLEAAAQTRLVGDKIIAALSANYSLAQHVCRSTPSIGAVLFDKQNMDELMKQADIAMYQAKQNGRNNLRFFDPQMQDAVNARAALERELSLALELGQFRLYYQVQMDSSRHPLGAEALIRWEHPERGLLFPAEFIQLAEETGMIVPIGRWVLETSCAQLSHWQKAEFTRGLVLSVNVSSQQFRQPDFVESVLSVVARYGIDPSRLKLELTESLLLDNIEETIANMHILKKIGILFSMDDFGTGYSSLQYLKRLPLDQIKIDQSFVRDIATDSNDSAIVHTIIEMAKSLNMDIIAEGVETRQQRQIILDNGCSHYQGYLFGKPVPIEEFDALLNDSGAL